MRVCKTASWAEYHFLTPVCILCHSIERKWCRVKTSNTFWVTYTERERRRLSWRLRLGLGDPEELDDEEERELEEPERLDPDELEPLEEPELEPELLLEVELDLDLNDINRNRLRKGVHFKLIFARNIFKLEKRTCCCCSQSTHCAFSLLCPVLSPCLHPWLQSFLYLGLLFFPPPSSLWVMVPYRKSHNVVTRGS